MCGCWVPYQWCCVHCDERARQCIAVVCFISRLYPQRGPHPNHLSISSLVTKTYPTSGRGERTHQMEWQSLQKSVQEVRISPPLHPLQPSWSVCFVLFFGHVPKRGQCTKGTTVRAVVFQVNFFFCCGVTPCLPLSPFEWKIPPLVLGNLSPTPLNRLRMEW